MSRILQGGKIFNKYCPGYHKEDKYFISKILQGRQIYYNIVQDIARREAEERARLEKAERAKRERRCPTCEMKVAMMVTMTMMTMVVTTVMSMVMLLMRYMSSYVSVKIILDDVTMV